MALRMERFVCPLPPTTWAHRAAADRAAADPEVTGPVPASMASERAERAEVRFYESPFPEVDDVVMVEVRMPAATCLLEGLAGIWP